MPKLNKPLCATEFGNTGFGDCFLNPGKFVGAIQVPKEFEIEESDITGLLTFLQTATSAGLGARIYPYPTFITLTDNTEDVTINTTDYGTRIPTRDGFYDWTFRYLNGGVQLHNSIAKNAGTSKYFLFYDDNGVLYGYKSAGTLKGIPVDNFIVPPWRPNTGADAALYTMRFLINPIYLNKGNLGFISVEDFNLIDVQGLQTVKLTLEDIVGNNVLHISAQTDISGVDLYDAYSAALTVAAWIATNKQTGATIAITSVTPNAGNKQFYVTLNLAAVNAMDPGDKIGIKWVAPATLAATYNVEGFESEELIVTVPAS